MMFSAVLNNSVMIDFRNMAIITAAAFGRAIPVLLTGILISIFRIAYFGLNSASLWGVIAVILSSAGCFFIKKADAKRWEKWTASTVFTVLVFSVILIMLLQNRKDHWSILLMCWASTAIVSAVTYWCVEYNRAANLLFLKSQ